MKESLVRMDVESYIKEKYPDVPPLDLIPGKIIRFNPHDKNNGAGWAILFSDGNGFVGDWSTDEKVKCFPKDISPKETDKLEKEVTQMLTSEINKICKSF